MKNILGIVGSLRKDSYNRMLMQAVAAELPAEVTFTNADIGGIPPFNSDIEDAFPAEAQRLKDQVLAADGIIITTPEYNRSIPGVLKNAIDWMSRPYGKNAWAGKPVLILGASMGNIGTALAQYHLKQIMLYLDARINGQPEFYLGMAQDKFDQDGNLTDQHTREHIKKALEHFLS